MIPTRRRLVVFPIALPLAACVQLVDRPMTMPASPNPAYPAGVPQSVTMGDWDALVINRVARDLSRDLTTSPALRRGLRAAVLPMIDNTGRSSLLAATLSDALRAELVISGKFAGIVLDHDMNRVLKQLQIEESLRHSAHLDPSVRTRIGQLLPADLLVFGRITDSATHLRVLAEMTDIARGDIVGVSQKLLEPGMRR